MNARELIPAGLLADVKNYLDITWDDERTDVKTAENIAQGIQYLNEKAGEVLNYETPGDGRRLLLEYCRYARDSALDVFEANYLSQILAMQNARKVVRYEAKTLSAQQ